MQIALDMLVYLLLGIISLGLLVALAHSIAPLFTPSLDEKSLADKVLECYTYNNCGTYRVKIREEQKVLERLDLYRVPYRWVYQGGEVVYVEKNGSEVVIYG